MQAVYSKQPDSMQNGFLIIVAAPASKPLLYSGLVIEWEARRMKYWMTGRVTDRPTGRVGINNQRKASCRRISVHRISRVRLTASLLYSPSLSRSLDLLFSINPISFAISRFCCRSSGNILETVQYETYLIQAINRKSCML